jgi:hypothetical protein
MKQTRLYSDSASWVSKTLRDKHEFERITHRVEEAKTEKILKEYRS